MGSVRGPGGAALRALLSVAAGLLACGGASEYDYVSYQSDLGPYPGGRFYAKPHQCVAIPADLRLCHSVGYDKMVLPNLLDHETMAEVKHQASSWVPLLNKNCHMGTQVFLCSLFAPVCLDRPVYPCRWLCEAVRDSCEPVMQFFGFFWPEMLKCDQFPQDDVCIAMTTPNATEVSRPKALLQPPSTRGTLLSQGRQDALPAAHPCPGAKPRDRLFGARRGCTGAGLQPWWTRARPSVLRCCGALATVLLPSPAPAGLLRAAGGCAALAA
ncbi:secreted frizzled-related protein 1 isoform X3 [Chiroxiphia lanceolata]|uniref:secreted frizzled-related protein 1 isoform X3 n=1 Tax=Chiroxiphia lanceolata TaxID=296741 RepID=UPI0013CE91C2|nr:secreted frizzled-related protein 1 isoform X3 [Chiroxiphia lanceolata]